MTWGQPSASATCAAKGVLPVRDRPRTNRLILRSLSQVQSPASSTGVPRPFEALLPRVVLGDDGEDDVAVRHEGRRRFAHDQADALALDLRAVLDVEVLDLQAVAGKRRQAHVAFAEPAGLGDGRTIALGVGVAERHARARQALKLPAELVGRPLLEVLRL